MQTGKKVINCVLDLIYIVTVYVHIYIYTNMHFFFPIPSTAFTHIFMP